MRFPVTTPKMIASKCPHNRKRYYCRECKGGAFCQHNRVKAMCKECGGKQVCVHGRQRPHCRECVGSAICIHRRQRNQCKLCNPNKSKRSNRCIHNRIKYYCRACGGPSFCRHGRRKTWCELCDPIAYLTGRIRSAVYGALKRKGTVKDKDTLELLGLDTWQQFQVYWKAKINEWNENNPHNPITPKNCAIDHIKPVSAWRTFVYGNPNHYTNLQPLPQNVNSDKSSKWDAIDEYFWQNNIYETPSFRRSYLPVDVLI